MKFTLSLSAEALFEETDAYNHYENIKVGLGEDILSEFIKSYDKISDNPLLYGYLQSSKILRSLKVARFPYLIIYIVSGSHITVLSVRNTHKRPFI